MVLRNFCFFYSDGATEISFLNSDGVTEISFLNSDGVTGNFFF